jgi:hypothetical protein
MISDTKKLDPRSRCPPKPSHERKCIMDSRLQLHVTNAHGAAITASDPSEKHRNEGK